MLQTLVEEPLRESSKVESRCRYGKVTSCEEKNKDGNIRIRKRQGEVAFRLEESRRWSQGRVVE